MKNLITVLVCSLIFIFSTRVSGAEPIQVVTTIGQITDIVKNIGGEKVSVIGLMGPGVDPHLYKASEGDVAKLSNADLIFYNGLFLEAKMEEVFKHLQKNRRKVAVAVAEEIDHTELLNSEIMANHFDPHIWFDVTLWAKAARHVADTLIKYDSANQNYYEERFQAYAKMLTELHQYVIDRAQSVAPDQRILVTAHDAFRYFGKRYEFNVVGLQGISTESAAGTKDVMELAAFIVEHKIPAIFIESSVPERNIQAVQEAVRSRGWEVKIGGELFSDAMGSEGTPEGTYRGMITHNINTIVNALSSKDQNETK